MVARMNFDQRGAVLIQVGIFQIALTIWRCKLGQTAKRQKTRCTLAPWPFLKHITRQFIFALKNKPFLQFTNKMRQFKTLNQKIRFKFAFDQLARSIST